MQPGYAPPQGSWPQQPQAPAPGGAYEFGPTENAMIEKAGSRARIWGVLSIVCGVLFLALGVLLIVIGGNDCLAQGLALVGFAIQPLVSGKFYHSAGAALRDVVRTSGNDVELMMSAVRKITGAVKIEAIAAILGILLGFIVGFVLATSKKG